MARDISCYSELSPLAYLGLLAIVGIWGALLDLVPDKQTVEMDMRRNLFQDILHRRTSR